MTGAEISGHQMLTQTRGWTRDGRRSVAGAVCQYYLQVVPKIDCCVRLFGRHIHRTLDRDANRIFGNLFRLGSFDQLATVGYLGLTLV